MEQINRYQNGKIYTIRSPNHELYYIGSTINLLNYRFQSHLKNDNPTTSKIIIGAGNAYIELLENYPCNNKEELNAREGALIREHITEIINKNRPSRTKREERDNQKKWARLHKETRKQYRDDHKEDHKEKYKHHYLKKYICNICNIELLNTNKYNHNKSISHINKMI